MVERTCIVRARAREGAGVRARSRVTAKVSVMARERVRGKVCERARTRVRGKLKASKSKSECEKEQV